MSFQKQLVFKSWQPFWNRSAMMLNHFEYIMADIFISHSGRDNQAAAVIGERLRRDRPTWSLFYDKDNIRAGQYWQERLREELTSCRVVLALLSRSWLDSHWCFTESVTATFRGKDVIGIEIEDLTSDDLGRAPPILHERQRVRLRDGADRPWQEILQALDRSGLDPDEWFPIPSSVSPYPGLVAFDEKDAGVFFGRKQEITDYLGILDALHSPDRSQMLVISGASGSGKSSLLRAGLFPRLRRKPEWVVIRPFEVGREPVRNLMDRLAEALASLNIGMHDLNLSESPADPTTLARILDEALRRLERATGAWVLLPLDQAEALVAAHRPEGDPARLLVDALAQLLRAKVRHAIVVATIRTEFMPRLEAAFAGPEVRLRHAPLSAIGSLAEIIEKPAERFGLELEPGLTERIVEDVHTADALPLLAYTLKALYETGGTDRRLTLDEYRTLGGVQGAIAAKLKSVLTDPEPTAEESRGLQRAFTHHLIRVDEGAVEGERLLRRVTPRVSLPQAADRLIGRLVDAGLLLTRTGTVELAHERLIDDWPELPLKTWLTQDASNRRLIDQLRQRVNDDSLPDGLLAQAEELLEVDQELAREEPELAKLVQRSRGQKRTRERRRVMFFGLTVVAALFFALLAGWGWYQRSEAISQAKLALGRQLAAQATTLLINNEVDSALLYAVKGFRTDNDFDTRDGLLSALEHSPQLVSLLRGHTSGLNGSAVHDVAFHPSRPVLASAGEDRRVMLWDITTRRMIGQLANHSSNGITKIAFSPDGTSLATLGLDGVWVWNVVDRTERTNLKGPNGKLASLAFSADGGRIATGDCIKVADRRCVEGQVIVWDSRTGMPLLTPLAVHGGRVTAVAFDPNGQTIASAGSDGTIRIWDALTGQPVGQPLSGHTDSIFALSFNRDGKRLASAGADRTIRLWDSATGTPHGTPLIGHDDAVTSIAFSNDDAIIASASWDKTVRLWQATTLKQIGEPVRGHRGAVNAVAFSSAGGLFASAGGDGVVMLADASRSSPIATGLDQMKGTSRGSTFSPDGRLLASGGSSGEIVLWDTTERKRYGRWVVAEGSREIRNESGKVTGWSSSHLFIESLAFHPNGKILISGKLDGLLEFRDVASGGLVGNSAQHPGEIRAVAFSPDGTSIASAGSRGTLVLWDAQTRQRLGMLEGHQAQKPGVNAPESLDVRSVAFSPNGRLLASGSFDETVILWDVATRKRVGDPLVGHRAAVDGVVFRPDGKMLASADVSGVILFWDPATGARSGHELRMPQKGYTRIAFSPDGKTLAAIGSAHLLVLWDVSSGEMIAHPFKGPIGQFESLAFAPDGKTVVTGDFEGHVVLWDVSIEAWIADACNKANRNFSDGEWRRIAPNADYERICSRLPVDISVVEQMLATAKAAGKARQSSAPKLYEHAATSAVETQSGVVNNQVCWFGSLDGFAPVVLPACERAVALHPDDAGWRDTRAIARALAGDASGAIMDLQFFLQSAQHKSDLSQYIPARKRWLDELSAGRNPFDDKLRATLREEN